MRALDLTEQVFGELTAISPTYVGKKKAWVCRCSCGNTKSVPTFQLTGGHVRTCGDGLHKQAIKVGDRFGNLTVASVYRDAKNRRYMAECSCECGGTKPNASFRNLQRGATPHCGCSPGKRKPSQSVSVSLRNALISNYKGNAKSKGLPFDLSDAECETLFKGDCYFCGLPPSSNYRKKPYEDTYLYSSIDRIDSNKGYIRGNVASCCTDCNYLKGNKANEVFLAHIHRIASHQGMAIRKVPAT